MTNHQGDESTLILDFDIANSAQTEYCSTFHFPSVPPWPLGPLGPMDHVDNLDILHHLDHSDRSNHFDNPDWSMIDQEDNCRIRIDYLVLLYEGVAWLLRNHLFHDCICPWILWHDRTNYIFSSHIICIYCYRLFHVGLPPKSSGNNTRSTKTKGIPNSVTKEKKTMSISSGLIKQLAGPVPTGVEDLVPLVQWGCCGGKHDQKLFLQA